MNRNSVRQIANESDLPSRSSVWSFAEAILGKPIPRPMSRAEMARAERQRLEKLAQYSTQHAEELRRLISAEGEARRHRELVEWAAGISSHAAKMLRALEREEASDCESLLEGNWDPSKHPRAGAGPNPGWWARKGSGTTSTDTARTRKDDVDSSTNDSSATTQSPNSTSYSTANTAITGMTTPTTPADDQRANSAVTASHTKSNGIPIQLAAYTPVGHHWIPQAVYGALKSKIAPDALKLFEEGTKAPQKYNHAFDTWDGVTHDEYSRNCRTLLDDWIRENGGRLKKGGAEEFLSWISNGKCDDAKFASKHKKIFEKIFQWRKGFLQSIVVAQAAADVNPKLTPAELKCIAQQVVNGKSTQKLSRAATKAAKAVAAGGRPLLRAAAKKILPGLTFLSAAAAAKRGWAGQGHTGDGAWGAMNEVARDVMMADIVEPIAFPAVLDTIDGLTNLLAPGLNAPGRDRYKRQGDYTIDFETGRVIH